MMTGISMVHVPYRGAGPALIDLLAMVVDKPFVFALRDRKTGLILMSGYVGRLSSGGGMAEAARWATRRTASASLRSKAAKLTSPARERQCRLILSEP